MCIERCPKENPDCRYYPSCYADEHHFYWPKKRYKGDLAKKFRNHPDNREVICRQDHDDIHSKRNPPPKPTAQEMALWLLNRR
jgi:hypothetical protein